MYLIVTEPKMIPADTGVDVATRRINVERIADSHSIYISQPQAVADFIKKAAKGGKAAAQTS